MIRTFFVALCFLISSTVSAQVELNSDVFDVLDLDSQELSAVKALHQDGKDSLASCELLNYFRTREKKQIETVNLKQPSEKDYKFANEALEHKFYVMDGYQPSFFYGDDINWNHWPVKDNELRWQLHRHKWFVPMGNVYKYTKDEKYAKEWVFQYMDWVYKNPLYVYSDALTPSERNCMDYAWRALEAAGRVRGQCTQFQLFLGSDSFTPEFLTQFLANIYKHANYVLHNFTSEGNQMLFEAQNMFYAGCFFSEFKDAHLWREKSVDILTKEVRKQVFSDGFQYELCPHYHVASINTFIKAYSVALENGRESDFPKDYVDAVEKMMVAYYNIMLPNYTVPLFSDNRTKSKQELIEYFKRWSSAYPQNEQFKYFATQRAEGECPEYGSRGFFDSGFFVFRSDWSEAATEMVVKTGPKMSWHSQPDNGTFELFMNGRNFFPDGGCYVYGGDESVLTWRDWFRQSSKHNTLTLDNKNMENTSSKTLVWNVDSDVQTLVTENQSYKDLKHRRSVFFVEKDIFVIVDEALGDAKGKVSVHYQFAPCETVASEEKMTVCTNFDDGNNVQLKVLSSIPLSLSKEEGYISYNYMKKEPRDSYSFNVSKKDSKTVRFITVISPKIDGEKSKNIKIKVNESKSTDNTLSAVISIGNKRYKLEYELNSIRN